MTIIRPHSAATPRRYASPAPRQSTRGIALVIALVFLLCLTLIGAASLSTNASEERMNYAMADYTRAFQASESAVEQAEQWILLQPVKPIPCGASCSSTSLVWAAPSQNPQYSSPSDLISSNWWTNNGLTFRANYLQDGTSTQRSYVDLSRTSSPQYLMEEIGNDRDSLLVGQQPAYTRWYFRVTGRGSGLRTQTAAVAQSVYVHGF